MQLYENFPFDTGKDGIVQVMVRVSADLPVHSTVAFHLKSVGGSFRYLSAP